MTRYVYDLGCEGAPHPNYPQDDPRCFRCIDGGCGEFEVQGEYLEAVLMYVSLLENAPETLVSIANRINSDGAVPPCPRTGAVRYCTGSLVRLD